MDNVLMDPFDTSVSNHNTSTTNMSIFGNRKFSRILPKPPSLLSKTANSMKSKQNNLGDLSLTEESVQQLSTNTIPTYCPVPPLIPVKEGYDVNCCPDYGSVYSLKSSLAFNLERRSILIKNSIDDSNLIPPIEQFESSLTELGEGSSMVRKESICPSKVKCFDCKKEFDSAEARKEHLTNDDKISATISQCNTCGMICPSKCHLNTHQRIHHQFSPYVCPECGESYDYSWEDFQHHVKYKCFHYARCIGYKCPLCKQVFPSNKSTLDHLKRHMANYLKCLSCNRSCTSPTAFEKHMNAYHNNMLVSHPIVAICTLCITVFLRHNEMVAHCSSHLKNRVCQYVFKCMECEIKLENKILLLEHIKSSHAILNRHIMQNETKKDPTRPKVSYDSPICNELMPTTYGAFKHSHSLKDNNSASPDGTMLDPQNICQFCRTSFAKHKDLQEHMTIKHSFEHPRQPINLASFQDTVEPLKKPCLERNMCAKCDFQSTDRNTFKEHLATPKKNKSTFQCQECGLGFVAKPVLTRHLRVVHGISDTKSYYLAEEGSNFILDTVKSAVVFSCDSALQEPGVQPLKKTEKNMCAKCDFQSTDRKAFKEHLVTHKANKSTYQCQECGFCFVVESALAKHLIVVHQISDTKNYLEEEGSNFILDTVKSAVVFSCDSALQEPGVQPLKKTEKNMRAKCDFQSTDRKALKEHLVTQRPLNKSKHKDLQEHMTIKHSFEHPRHPINLASFQDTVEPLKKPCLEGNMCAKCDFQSTDRNTFKEHLATHKKNKRTFQCQECDLCFVAKPVLTRHLRVVHGISDTKSYYLAKEGSNFKLDTLKSAVVFSCDSALQEPGVQPLKKTEKNMCAKCDFQSTDRKAFKEHLVTHKANKSTYQCQECGFCFVVESALAKHLIVVHRISDTKNYLEEEGSNFMLDVATAEKVLSGALLICSVCCETFKKEIALKGHKRSHGMAFIHDIKSKAAK